MNLNRERGEIEVGPNSRNMYSILVEKVKVNECEKEGGRE